MSENEALLLRDPILILHLSDLHFGEHSRFAEIGPEGFAGRVASAVRAQRTQREIAAPISLVVVTGDVVQTAHREEYAEAHEFFAELATRIELDAGRFVFVPGNHDVDWHACEAAEAGVRRVTRDPDEGQIRTALDCCKFEEFEAFLDGFCGHPRTEPGTELCHGAFAYEFDDLPVSVGALNSCEAESHRIDDHRGQVCEAQAESLMQHWQAGGRQALLKIVALHHHCTPSPTGDLAKQLDEMVTAHAEQHEDSLDPDLLRRFLVDAFGICDASPLRNLVSRGHAQLVLHGHHHEATGELWAWQDGPGLAHVLGAGSAGLEPAALPQDQPNSFQLVLMDAAGPHVRSCRSMYAPLAPAGPNTVADGGFVSHAPSLWEHHQHLDLPEGWPEPEPAPEAAEELPPTPDPLPPEAALLAPTPPQSYFAHPYPMQAGFTGRLAEREMLTEWLAEGRESALALIAIGGMGKSALTWAWVQRDVLGLPLPGMPLDDCGHDSCRVADGARPEGVLWWSFYEREASFGAFLNAAITYCSGGGIDPAEIPSDHDKVAVLGSLLQQRRVLVVLDGFERALRAYASLNAAYQGDDVEADAREEHRACTDPHAAQFMRWLAGVPLRSRVLMTSRLFPLELEGCALCRRQELKKLALADAVAFMQAQGVKGIRADFERECASYDGHPLALRLLAGVIMEDLQDPGDIKVAAKHPVSKELVGRERHHVLMVAYDTLDEHQQTLLSSLAAFRGPMDYEAASAISLYEEEGEFEASLRTLMNRGLVFRDREQNRYDLHPIVRRHAYDRLGDRESVHGQLRDYFDAVPEPEKIESVDDLAATIELYHHTVNSGRYDEAYQLYRDRLDRPIYFQLGAYQTSIQLVGGCSRMARKVRRG